MIFSSNNTPDLVLFEALLDRTNDWLNQDALIRPQYYKDQAGRALENVVFEVMVEMAKGTLFEDSIECVSGQKFPDIIAKNYYGVEVKSTIKDHWFTTGNSIAESTRVPGIERIFLMFGKLGGEVGFRYKPYEECLTEIVVTHSPRYKIDMDVQKDKTIFHRMNTTYDALRESENPIGQIINYYRSVLKEHESLWWVNSMVNEEEGNPPVLRIMESLSKPEKDDLIAYAFAHYPEIFYVSRNKNKYKRYALWLYTQSIASTSLRDNFTAGGQGNLHVGGQTYKNAPKVFHTFYNIAPKVREEIINAEEALLLQDWRKVKIESDRLKSWLSVVSEHLTKDNNTKYIEMIRCIINCID